MTRCQKYFPHNENECYLRSTFLPGATQLAKDWPNKMQSFVVDRLSRSHASNMITSRAGQLGRSYLANLNTRSRIALPRQTLSHRTFAEATRTNTVIGPRKVSYQDAAKKTIEEVKEKTHIPPVGNVLRVEGDDFLIFPRNIHPEMTEEQAEERYRSLFEVSLNPSRLKGQKHNFVPPKEDQKLLFRLLGLYTDKTVIGKSGQLAYDSTNWHCENKDFYDGTCDPILRQTQIPVYNIAPTFIGWFSLSLLHLWMAEVRSRPMGYDGRQWRVAFNRFFWNDVESRILALGVSFAIMYRFTDVGDKYTHARARKEEISENVLRYGDCIR